MASTSNSTDEILDNFTNYYINDINHRLNIGTINKADANILYDMLYLVQTNPELLNVVKEFNLSFLNLSTKWTSNNGMDSSTKLASLLISLLV